MASRAILEDLLAGCPSEIDASVQSYLSPVLQAQNDEILSSKDASSYGSFAVKFLYSSVSQLTTDNVPCSLVRGLLLCCDCYLKTRNNVQLGDPLTVHRLLHNVLVKFQPQNFQSEYIQLANHLLTLCVDTASNGLITKITSATYAALWNAASVLDKEQKVSPGFLLECRLLALKFLSFKPDLETTVLEKIKFSVHQYCGSRKSMDKIHCDLNVLGYCKDIVHLLMKRTEHSWKKTGEICCQIYISLLDQAIRTRDFVLAEEVIAEMSRFSSVTLDKGCQSDSLLMATQLCQLSLCLARDGNCQYHLLAKTNNSVLLKLQQIDNVCTGLSPLSDAYCLLQQQLSSLPCNQLVRIIVEQGPLQSFDVHHEIVNVNLQFGKKEKSSSDVKGNNYIKLEQLLVECCYKKLQLIIQCHGEIEVCAASNLVSEAWTTVERLQTLLERKSDLPPKHRDTARYNCGYITYKLGQYCCNEDNLQKAIDFYRVSCSQFSKWCCSQADLKQERCQKANLWKLYECLIHCQRKTQQWPDAMATIVNSVCVNQDHLTAALGLWARVKHDAASEKILQMTFNKAIQQYKVQIAVPPVQVARAELTALRQLSRRLYPAELIILQELYKLSCDPVDKALVIIDMAENMWVSKSHADSEIEKKLDEILRMFDENDTSAAPPDQVLVLAVTYLWKFILQNYGSLQDPTCINTAAPKSDQTPVTPGGEAEEVLPPASEDLYNFQMEKKLLRHLTKSQELWEKYLSFGERSRLSYQGSVVHSLMLCEAILTAMRKPVQAMQILKILDLVRSSMEDIKLKTEFLARMVRALIHLGRYREAECVLQDYKALQGETTEGKMYSLIHQAELALYDNQLQHGSEILSEGLQMDIFKKRSKMVVLIRGILSRLLSTFLCLPGEHVTSLSANHYALSCASDAVRLHKGLFQSLTVKECGDATSGFTFVEKWTALSELLQSLYQMGQLYRVTGIPREAMCYLKEGLTLAQEHRLPRWSAEFLLEILRVNVLTASTVDALSTASNVEKILAPDSMVFSTMHSQIQDKCSTPEIQTPNNTPEVASAEENCFGFENVSCTPAAQSCTSGVSLGDHSLQAAVRSLHLPQCSCCLAGDAGPCTDVVRHKICLKAGIVYSQVCLSVCESHDQIFQTLTDVDSQCSESAKSLQLKDCILDSLVSQVSVLDISKQFKKPSNTRKDVNSICKLDPKLKSFTLESQCLLAELYLRDHQLGKVLEICQHALAMEREGAYSNVFEGNVLLARMKICQATCLLYSLHPRVGQTGSLMNVGFETSVKQGTNDQSSCSKTGYMDSVTNLVSFGVSGSKRKGKQSNGENRTENEEECVKGLKTLSIEEPDHCVQLTEKKKTRGTGKVKLNRFARICSESDIGSMLDSIPSAKLDTFKTPKMGKVSKSIPTSGSCKKLQRSIFGTASKDASVRRAALDFLLEVSDDDSPRPSTYTSAGQNSGDKTLNGDSFACSPDFLKTSQALNFDDQTVLDKEDKKGDNLDDCDKQSETKHKGTQSKMTKKMHSKGHISTKEQDSAKELVSKSSGRRTTVKSNHSEKSSSKENLDKSSKENTGIKSGKAGRGGGRDCAKKLSCTTSVRKNSADFLMEVTADESDRFKVPLCEHSKGSDNHQGVYDFASSSPSVVKSKSTRGRKPAKSTVSQGKSTSSSKTRSRMKPVPEKEVGRSEVTSPAHDTGLSISIEEEEMELEKDLISSPAFSFDLKILEEPLENDPLQKKMEEKWKDEKHLPKIQVKKFSDTSLDNNTIKVVDSWCSGQSYRGKGRGVKGDKAGMEERRMFFQADCNLDDSIEILRGGSKRGRGRGRGKSVDTNHGNKSSDILDHREEQTGCELHDDRADNLNTPHELSLTEVPRSSCMEAQKKEMRMFEVESRRQMDVTDCSMSNVSSITSTLENAYEQIRHFPPCPSHAAICQMLAVQYLNNNPKRAAFLLTEAMAVSFRHQEMLLVEKKIRKIQKQDKNLLEKQKSGEEIGERTADTSSLQQIKSDLYFNKTEENLQTMIDSIPQGWTVCQISLAEQGLPAPELLLTRLEQGHEPFVQRLPGFRSPVSQTLLGEFDSIMCASQGSMKVTDKEEWWSLRRDLNDRMERLVENIENFLIGHMRGLFSGKPSSENRPAFNKVVRETRKKIKSKTKMDLSDLYVEILLLLVQHASDFQLKMAVADVLCLEKSSAHVAEVATILTAILDQFTVDNTQPLILILDKAIQHLPWESISVLEDRTVTRMPSLYHMYTQLSNLQSQESSIFVQGVHPSRTYYILNPENNLSNTQSTFQDWFEREPGWKGIVGQQPTPEQFAEALTQWDMLIYCGHGSGSRFLHGDDIQLLRARAAAILMGCSSGKLKVKGQLEATGLMLSYFLAGCPCIVANLWDVTDKDIDRYLDGLLKSWLRAEEGTSLPLLVSRARKVCKLPHLIGCAPVVYGFPVYLKKGDITNVSDKGV